MDLITPIRGNLRKSAEKLPEEDKAILAAELLNMIGNDQAAMTIFARNLEEGTREDIESVFLDLEAEENTLGDLDDDDSDLDDTGSDLDDSGLDSDSDSVYIDPESCA